LWFAALAPTAIAALAMAAAIGQPHAETAPRQGGLGILCAGDLSRGDRSGNQFFAVSLQ
jgi:hypothetical protein